MIRVTIVPRVRKTPVSERRLREVVRRVLAYEGIPDAKISLVFVTDAAMTRLNRQFLAHRGTTDVITFPATPPFPPLRRGGQGGWPLEGEIVISTDVARRLARELGHSVQKELILYVVHGLLHLCGYDDRNPRDRRALRKRQAYHLKKIGIRMKEPQP